VESLGVGETTNYHSDQAEDLQEHSVASDPRVADSDSDEVVDLDEEQVVVDLSSVEAEFDFGVVLDRFDAEDTES